MKCGSIPQIWFIFPMICADPSHKNEMKSTQVCGWTTCRVRGSFHKTWCLTGKDTVVSEVDLLVVLVVKLQSVQTDVVRVSPGRQQLQLKDDWMTNVKEDANIMEHLFSQTKTANLSFLHIMWPVPKNPVEKQWTLAKIKSLLVHAPHLHGRVHSATGGCILGPL